MYFSLDFNSKPIKFGKGSAIFIHIAKKNYSKTKGCIAINKANLIKIVKKLIIKQTFLLVKLYHRKLNYQFYKSSFIF